MGFKYFSHYITLNLKLFSVPGLPSQLSLQGPPCFLVQNVQLRIAVIPRLLPLYFSSFFALNFWQDKFVFCLLICSFLPFTENRENERDEFRVFYLS